MLLSLFATLPAFDGSLPGILAALCGLVAFGIVAAPAAGGAAAGAGAPAAGGSSAEPPAAGEEAGDVIEIVHDEPAPQNAAGEGVDPDDDLEPDDHVDQAIRDHPEYKRLRNRTRSLQRKLAKVSPTAERLKGLNLDDLTFKARSYDAINEQIQRNPKLRALLGGDAEDGASSTGGARGKAPAAGDDFDESQFPFDPEAPGSAFLLQQARSLHSMSKRLEQQDGLIRRLADHLTGRQQAEVAGAWKSATDQAATRLPEKVRIGQGETATVVPLREMFRDTVYGAFQTLRSQGRPVTKEIATQVIKHYLGEFGVTSKGKSSAAAAAATQRNAETANRWPQRGALASQGTPASPRQPGENAFQAINRVFRGRRAAPRA
jgi:hypothetical protein